MHVCGYWSLVAYANMIWIYMVHWVLMKLLDVDHIVTKDKINFISCRYIQQMVLATEELLPDNDKKRYGIQKV